ncbi:membrane metalloprotease ARASP, chloroplastic [Selaginella moellendorffii]|nr:membrane metalloprotease ARASP, chloroplastic [Selaginella moellendorffii]|eukprot:XP_024526597.1 membrane metalloprotease ARASP, chloroplastic [Selaginella moellendorffii]
MALLDGTGSFLHPHRQQSRTILTRKTRTITRILVARLNPTEDRRDSQRRQLIINSSSSRHGRIGKKLLAIPPAFSALGGTGLEGPESVLQAVGVLTVIILVHEAGHFLAARLQNIHVSKFSIGFGPKLATFQRKEVEYSIRAIPLGGYVGFPDDNPDSEFSPEDPDLLKNRPILDRVLVMSAGVFANIVFAYTLLFTQTLTVGLLQQKILPGVVVPEVYASSAAARAGVRPADVILALDGQEVRSDERSVMQIVDVIKQRPGKKIQMLLQRRGEAVTVDIFPDRSKDGYGRIGVQLSPNIQTFRVKARDLADATVQASREFWKLGSKVVEGLAQVVVNFAQTADKVSGPVAIVAVGAEVARSDVAGLFQFAALLNLNLAVVNILPLPALDGGYLALIALEALRGGKKLPDKIEQGIMSSGILLILALGIVLMVRDTLNLGLVQGL